MALKSFALRRDTPTISFNPYRDPTARPFEGEPTSRAQEESASSDVLNKQIGLGVGLSAFFLSIIGLVAYGIFRRSQRRRQRQELGAPRIEERQGMTSVPPESLRSVDDREMEDVVGDTPNDPEVGSKHSSIDVRADGHERGESSLSGGIVQPTYESGVEERANQRRNQSFQESEQSEGHISPVHR
jgi:hypothetical protein